jgi:hypothetical protein
MKQFCIIAFLMIFSIEVSAQSASGIKIERDIKTPLLHKFDPMTVPDVWINIASEETEEMPLPSGIDEKLRKEVDAARMAKLKQSNISNRKIIDAPPTPQKDFNPSLLKGTDVNPGSGTPNDNHIAVANDGKFIGVMNTVIRIFNDTGKPIKTWSLENFIIPNKKINPFTPLTRTFDPRVVYDPYEDRFIVVYMHGDYDKTSFIVVGFSSPGDPLKPWNVYKIPGNPLLDSAWSDYPIVAHNKEDIFITLNILGNGTTWEEGFRQAIIWQLRKEDGYKGDTMHKNFFHNIKFQNKPVRSICAIQNGPMPNGTDNYFVSVRPIDAENDTVFLHRITNTQKSGVANIEMKLLKSPETYGFPSSALQPDTGMRFKLRTNDCRVLSGIRSGNQIQFMQNSMNFKTLQAHLMHSTIYNANDVAPIIQSKLYTDDTLDFGYPALAYASMNENDPSVIITSVYSSFYHYPGVGMLYRNRYGEYSNYIKLKKGSSLINYTYIKKDEQRWGDYEGIQAKYNEPGVFYCVGSYGKQNDMHAYISRIKINDKFIKQPVESVRVFPIPSNDGILNIEVSATQNAVYHGEIYNITAQSISNKTNHNKIDFAVEAGTHLYQLHTHNLAPGIYQIHILNNSNDIILTKKIQIQ